VSSDNVLPAEFTIDIQKNPTTFSGNRFIVFNTTDKQTGIDHYEVIEEPISKFAAFDWGRADAPWTIQKSPYELKDQTLNSIIRVKAIDKAGNEYIATLVPDEANRTLSLGLMLATIVVGAFILLIIAIIVTIIVRYRNRRKNKLNNSSVSDYDESKN
jgi:hypothetical protein